MEGKVTWLANRDHCCASMLALRRDEPERKCDCLRPKRTDAWEIFTGAIATKATIRARIVSLLLAFFESSTNKNASTQAGVIYHIN